MVQLLHLYMTTGKTITWIIQTFVSKGLSLLFNILSRFVIAFLPGSNSLLISWLYSPSTVILEPKKIKTVTVSTFSPCICHEVMGPEATISVFWMLSFKFFSMHTIPFTWESSTFLLASFWHLSLHLYHSLALHIDWWVTCPSLVTAYCGFLQVCEDCIMLLGPKLGNWTNVYLLICFKKQLLSEWPVLLISLSLQFWLYILCIYKILEDII